MRDKQDVYLTYLKLYHWNYGLENRNAFYDKKFAQEWIHVMPWIKNQTPKVFFKKIFTR